MSDGVRRMTAADGRLRVTWLWPVVGCVAVLGLAYAAWAGYLAVFSTEGVIPPHWRVPDVPRGASVVSETKECASGGCWRQVLLRPAAGRSPAQLAADMGVAEERRHPWRLLDPHGVTVGSHVTGPLLEVFVQY